jgi:hypothetical protein
MYPFALPLPYVLDAGGQNFQRRFLVLRGPFILNYISEEHTDPKGIIVLDGARLVVTPGVPSPVKKQPAVKRALMSFLTNEDKRTPFSFTVARPSGMRYEVRPTIRTISSTVVYCTWNAI